MIRWAWGAWIRHHTWRISIRQRLRFRGPRSAGHFYPAHLHRKTKDPAHLGPPISRAEISWILHFPREMCWNLSFQQISALESGGPRCAGSSSPGSCWSEALLPEMCRTIFSSRSLRKSASASQSRKSASASRSPADRDPPRLVADPRPATGGGSESATCGGGSPTRRRWRIEIRHV